MKNYEVLFLFVVLLFLWACNASKKTTLNKVIKQTPNYSIGTCWETELKSVSKKLPNAKPSIKHSTFVIDTILATPYGEAYQGAFEIKEEYKKGRVTILKKNLTMLYAILEPEGDTIHRKMEFVNFPLFVGKKWTANWIFQEFPHSEIIEAELKFEVVRQEKFDYIQDQELEVETQAFVIKLSDGQNRDGYYHYILPSNDFPGSSILDVWSELERGKGSISRHYSFQLTGYCAAEE